MTLLKLYSELVPLFNEISTEVTVEDRTTAQCHAQAMSLEGIPLLLHGAATQNVNPSSPPVHFPAPVTRLE